MSARTLKVATKDGPVEVPVYARSHGLAITGYLLMSGAVDAGRFKITHEKSGMSICWIPIDSLSVARRALRRTARLTDWTRTAKALSRQRTLQRRIEAALADAGVFQ